VAGCQKVHVYQTDATPHEGVALDKEEYFIVIGLRGGCQRMQQGRDLSPILQVAAGKLSENKGMEKHFFLLKQLRKTATGLSEVVNPYRRVNQYHYAILRRRTRFASGSLPPSETRRCALRRATSASSPMRTNVVFSRTPVSRDASFRIASSILSVVFIHTRMGDMDVCVKRSV
jgi:hypothetical protein